MNERIRQLAVQAGILLRQKDFSYFWVESAEDIEKFAQLIVRECAQAMLDYGKTYAHLSAGEYQSDEFSKVIKQHFGVEE
jgi:chloramphenicol O-acetyltransferase